MNKTGNNLFKNNLSKNNSKVGNTGNAGNAGSTGNIKNSYVNTSSANTPTSGSSVFGIMLMIFIIVAIAGASYWLYNYYTSKTFQSFIDAELLPDISDASSPNVIPSSSIPSSSFSNEYSISCWVNIQDFNYEYGNEKVIVRRGDKGAGNPEILLDKKTNNLIVRVKLQGGTAGKSGSVVSKFQDIPIHIKSQNLGNGFIIPESVNTEKSDMITNNMPDSFNKIGSNDIDYPTIHYTFDKNSTGSGSDISQCGYFDLISGNNVNANPDIVTSNGNKLVEGFADSTASVNDAVNATVAIVVDMCNIAKTIQDQQFADNSVDSLNNAFQSIIDVLEKSRTTAKTDSDINAAIASLSISSPTQQSSNSILSQQFDTLATDIKILSKMNAAKIDYNTIFTAINNKMVSINCPLTINSTTEIDGTISFYENIINLLKKSIFTYINNMGSGIKKIYPELAGKNTASCLIENNMNSDPTVGICMVKMIPLQKWVNIIVSVYNQIIDIYIDGQLSSSCVLKGFPAISTADANVTPDGGFSGKISRVLFSNSAMTITRARNIYYSGPVATVSLFSMIPNWVYWTIFIVIVIALAYSFMM